LADGVTVESDVPVPEPLEYETPESPDRHPLAGAIIGGLIGIILTVPAVIVGFISAMSDDGDGLLVPLFPSLIVLDAMKGGPGGFGKLIACTLLVTQIPFEGALMGWMFQRGRRRLALLVPAGHAALSVLALIVH
jgi:hypothetical protein